MNSKAYRQIKFSFWESPGIITDCLREFGICKIQALADQVGVHEIKIKFMPN
jgi:hypothetical protein